MGDVQKSPETTLDTDHCDPKADVIIISSDKVEFRAHSYGLSIFRYICLTFLSSPSAECNSFRTFKEKGPPASLTITKHFALLHTRKFTRSKFFADILSLPPSATEKNREPISIHFPSITVKAFLDVATARPAHKILILQHLTCDLDLLMDLYKLLDFTLCDIKWTSIIRSEICLSAQRQPEEVLRLASVHHDKEFAGQALMHMKNFEIPQFCGQNKCERMCDYQGIKGCVVDVNYFQAWFSRLGSEYQIELLQLMLIRIKNRYGISKLDPKPDTDYDEDDWQWLAARFDPTRPMSERI